MPIGRTEAIPTLTLPVFGTPTQRTTRLRVKNSIGWQCGLDCKEKVGTSIPADTPKDDMVVIRLTTTIDDSSRQTEESIV